MNSDELNQLQAANEHAQQWEQKRLESRAKILSDLRHNHGVEAIDAMLVTMDEDQVINHFYRPEDLSDEQKLFIRDHHLAPESKVFKSFLRLRAMAQAHHVDNPDMVAATLAAPMNFEGIVNVASGNIEVCGSLE